MSERERLSEEYDCDVVGCRVRVDVLKVTLRGAPGGAGPVPFGTAFQMKGCDGNATYSPVPGRLSLRFRPGARTMPI